MPKFIKETDIDGNWHELAHQQEVSSCGPACVKIVKEHVGNKPIGEDYLRGLVTIFEKNQAHQGISALDAKGHDWATDGSYLAHLLEVIKANPVGVPGARIEKWPFRPHLEKTNPRHPAIIQVAWAKNAHWIVVLGPSRTAKDKFIVLDPFYGVQQISWTGDPVRYTWVPDPKRKDQPKFNFNGTVARAPGILVTY